MMSSTKISLLPPTSNAPENITPTKSHKRQASIGLGIVTHLTEPTIVAPRRESISKNDTFFDTATSFSSQMKPPPSLSLSTKHKDHSYHHQQQQQLPFYLHHHPTAAITAAAAQASSVATMAAATAMNVNYSNFIPRV